MLQGKSAAAREVSHPNHGSLPFVPKPSRRRAIQKVKRLRSVAAKTLVDSLPLGISKLKGAAARGSQLLDQDFFSTNSQTARARILANSGIRMGLIVGSNNFGQNGVGTTIKVRIATT